MAAVVVSGIGVMLGVDPAGEFVAELPEAGVDEVVPCGAVVPESVEDGGVEVFGEVCGDAAGVVVLESCWSKGWLAEGLCSPEICHGNG